MATSTRKQVSQRHLERKVLHAEHARLCDTLSPSSILPELYSARIITSDERDRVDAADTRRDKNRRLLRRLELRCYPIKDLCGVLDKFKPFENLAKELRAAVEKKRKEYETKKHRKERGRCTVSPQQLPVHKKTLSDEKMQFSILTGRLGQILDCYPEALQLMKTAMKFATVPDGDEPLLSVVQSHSFIEAAMPSSLIESLAPITSVVDNTYFQILVHASNVPDAIQLLEAYLKTSDPTQELVVFIDQSQELLHDPPPSSEAREMGCREMAVQTERECVAVGEVQEMKIDIAGVLNIPREGIIGQGVRESSASVIFWISERLIHSIQNEYIDLHLLRFLCDENVSQIQIEDVYMLTTPSAECLDFWEACLNGDIDTVQASLSAEVDVNVATPPQHEACTGLMIAAMHGNNEVVHLLLVSGADPNILSARGSTALMAAAQYGHAEVAEVLLGEGAHINTQNKERLTALMLAAEWGHVEVADALLREGIDVTVQDEEGYTALHWAAQYGHTTVAASLLKASSDPNSMASWRGGTSPLMLAAFKGNVAIVDLLLSAGAEVNTVTTHGVTALMLAAKCGHVDVVETLIEGEADVNMLTENGVSALDFAQQQNHPQVCDILEKQGAKQSGPGSQERAKISIAKLFDGVRQILNPSFISRLDFGGVKARKVKKERATAQN